MSSDLLKEFASFQRPAVQAVIGQLAASNEEPEDDFGEFEDADPKSGSQPIYGSVVKSSLNDDSWGDFETGGVLFDADLEHTLKDPKRSSTSQAANKKALPPPPPLELEDTDFEAWEPQDAMDQAIQTESLVPQAPIPESAKRAPAPTLAARKADLGPPPTNVPPPSILLSVSVLDVQSVLPRIKAIAEMPGKEGLEFLQRCISNLHATARVLAGRKLRWKRDKILSQSMSIGQAGKQGGMKLTVVDKGESRREDQEAAELLKVWKQQVGPLRSFLSTLKSGPKVSLPGIADSMPVRVGQSADGAVQAPKPCFLCGLKRDERVNNVDVNVEDSFGEWWVEHWGHLDCCQFWAKQKDSLPHR